MTNLNLSPHLEATILATTSASRVQVTEMIQELWSGYGNILRLELDGERTVIAKHVRAADSGNHPRGWDTDVSHQRKLRSYEVESVWYQNWSQQCDEHCRVPRLLVYQQHDSETLLLLEDLDAAGYPVRLNSVNDRQLDACLSWLAHFHATFLHAAPTGLWKTGTYWHLETRADELAVLDDRPLKNAAREIDLKLKAATYQTLVHGDAKLANFCFSEDGQRVAAVDFQYVGGGCGMKDLAYFLGSCLDESACEQREAELLDTYFTALRLALETKHPRIDPSPLESEWRALFPIAWTDFHRFLKGWSPGHWKINTYSERLARQVIASLS
ncbi:phosphotransferase [Haloferula chungangensis]|uniref:Phosphotransferase n=1 Tax=Haloferula chungangensis TaxID=1048331 RepID=A0ABW2L487_9BACT